MTDYFIAVARTGEDAAGKTRRVSLNGRATLIANVEGHSHEDASLSLGRPLHGSRFSVVTGASMEEPATGPLSCYPVRIIGDSIHVQVSDS